MADGLGRKELFCISAIIGGGPEYTVVLGANFHRAYYTVYEYDAATDTAKVRNVHTQCRLLSTLCAGPVYGSQCCDAFEF